MALCADGSTITAARCDALPASGVTAVFAFRRLKIIDLSDTAAQPMCSNSGRTWIVFNGEIYNFQDLRKELSSRGRTFRTQSDTEVILEAYEEWGTACFNRFEGMWGIVIGDLARRTLVASRDRFGIKPLHWARVGSSLLFSSEIRQIVAAMPGAPRANASRVALHLQGVRYPVTDETFVDGIRSLPAASWAEIPLHDSEVNPSFQAYWKLSAVADPTVAYATALDRFDEVFRDAIRSHHVADVAVGSLLSGGLDSSSVTAVLASLEKREGRDLPTYSFGFRGEFEKYSELKFVETLVRSHQLRNFETTLDASWVAQNVAKVIETIEEPALSIAVLAQFRVFELCRQHGTTVVLDGQGSDEILAGYPYHQRLAAIERLRSRDFLGFAREISMTARGSGTSSWALVRSFFVDPLLRRLKRKRQWINPTHGRDSSSADLAAARADSSADPSLVNRRLYFDLRWGNAKIILGYADRNAMAHSIEARVPFFDRKLVELAYSLPAAFKTLNGERKRILRDFARRIGVPAQITERTDRMGFGTPDAELIGGPLKAQILDAISDTQLSQQDCFDREGLRSLVADFQSGRTSDLRAIWRVYTLAKWSDGAGVKL